MGGVDIVCRAKSGSEALRAISDLRPDCVILDISMPGGTGLDVLGCMERGGESPMVIVLTNYSYSQYRKRCLQIGARFFFDKSTEIEKVVQVLRDVICDSSEKKGLA